MSPCAFHNKLTCHLFWPFCQCTNVIISWRKPPSDYVCKISVVRKDCRWPSVIISDLRINDLCMHIVNDRQMPPCDFVCKMSVVSLANYRHVDYSLWLSISWPFIIKYDNYSLWLSVCRSVSRKWPLTRSTTWRFMASDSSPSSSSMCHTQGWGRLQS